MSGLFFVFFKPTHLLLVQTYSLKVTISSVRVAERQHSSFLENNSYVKQVSLKIILSSCTFIFIHKLSQDYHTGDQKPCFHLMQQAEVKHSTFVFTVPNSPCQSQRFENQPVFGQALQSELFLNDLSINEHLACNRWSNYITLKHNCNLPSKFITFGTAI